MFFKKKPIQNNLPIYLPKIDRAALLQPKEVVLTPPKEEFREMHVRGRVGERLCPELNIFTEKSADGMYVKKYDAKDSNNDGIIDVVDISIFKILPQSQSRAHHLCESSDGKSFHSDVILPKDEQQLIYGRCEYDADCDGVAEAGNESYYYESGQLQSNIHWNDDSGLPPSRVDYYPNGEKNKKPNLEADPATQYREVITYTAKP